MPEKDVAAIPELRHIPVSVLFVPGHPQRSEKLVKFFEAGERRLERRSPEARELIRGISWPGWPGILLIHPEEGAVLQLNQHIMRAKQAVATFRRLGGEDILKRPDSQRTQEERDALYALEEIDEYERDYGEVGLNVRELRKLYR